MYNNFYEINKHTEKLHLQVDKKKTPKTHNENASIREFFILKIQEVNVLGKVVCLMYFHYFNSYQSTSM